MRVRAGEAHAVALHAERPEHDAERQVELLEHRPLLDVQLEVGGGAAQPLARLAHPVELDAVSGQRVRQCRPVAVGQAAHRVGVERARAGARAHQAAAEARALLVGPVDQLQADVAWLVRERAQHLEAADHVERAVEPAAVRDRVDVAADDHEAIVIARRAGPRVAGLIGLDRHAVDPVELAAQPLARGDPGVGPGDALSAVVIAGTPPQLLQPGDGARRVRRRHQRTAAAGAGCANERCRKRPFPGSDSTSPSR
jgi:hypothetical protein